MSDVIRLKTRREREEEHDRAVALAFSDRCYASHVPLDADNED